MVISLSCRRRESFDYLFIASCRRSHFSARALLSPRQFYARFASLSSHHFQPGSRCSLCTGTGAPSTYSFGVFLLPFFDLFFQLIYFSHHSLFHAHTRAAARRRLFRPIERFEHANARAHSPVSPFDSVIVVQHDINDNTHHMNSSSHHHRFAFTPRVVRALSRFALS